MPVGNKEILHPSLIKKYRMRPTTPSRRMKPLPTGDILKRELTASFAIISTARNSACIDGVRPTF